MRIYVMVWGSILMDSLNSTLKSGSGIIKARNESTGKTSGKSTDSTQANWSTITTDFYTSIMNIFQDDNKLESLVKGAGAFIQAKNAWHGDLKSKPDAIPYGEHALFVEESGDEDDEESGDEPEDENME